MTWSASPESGDLPAVLLAASAGLTALLAASIPRSFLVGAVALACVAAAFGASIATRGRHGLRTPAIGGRVIGTRATGVVAAVVLCSGLCGLVGLRAQQDLAGLEAPLPGSLEGSAQLGSDPETSPFGASAEVVLGGRRWLATFERSQEWAVLGARAGDRLWLAGSVSDLDGAPAGWVTSRHLSGRLRVAEARPEGSGQPWFVAANAVHELLERGAASMEGQHRALYLGLVVGDDRGQDEMTAFRFRASGLTHLLAVSGQNMAFVLVALAPVMRRIPMRSRWVLGVSAVLSFMLVTRAEPSVLRAGTMAALALAATTLGRPVPALRLVGLTVCLLLVADPMLVHSVGFRLSVAATTSLVVLVQPLARWLPGPRALGMPLAVTLAAQVGAIPVMALTFGPTSVVAVPANLLAEPAAALVMTLGMTTGLLAGLVREELAWVLQLPVRIGVWWIDAVAAWFASLSVPPLGLVGWAVVAAGALGSTWLWRSGSSRQHHGSSSAGPGARRGSPALALVVLAAPMVLLLRPPTPDGHVGELTDGVVLDGRCAGWSVRLALGDPSEFLAEGERVGVVEALWQAGITRAETVSGRGAAHLAPTLDATVAPPPMARGSPC